MLHHSTSLTTDDGMGTNTIVGEHRRIVYSTLCAHNNYPACGWYVVCARRYATNIASPRHRTVHCTLNIILCLHERALKRKRLRRCALHTHKQGPLFNWLLMGSRCRRRRRIRTMRHTKLVRASIFSVQVCNRMVHCTVLYTCVYSK